MRIQLCTLFLFFSLFAGYNSYSQVTTIWGGTGDPNGEFNSGLNDWTAVGISSETPDSAENTLWVWKANAEADSGSFWGARGPIESPSAGNGAAVFDSDYLDNLGNAQNPDGTLNPDAFGTGPSPGPHRGELISPVIDCSNHSSVTIQFNQYFRNFEASTFVGVSNDNGLNWTDIQINESIPGNSSTGADNVMLIDISDLAAGSSEVQIRFAFDGNYYFWIIDDVWLFEKPANDLALGDTLFYPPASQYQPLCYINRDTMGFDGEVQNKGGETQTNIVFKAEVLDELGELIFADSTVLDSLPTGLPDSVVTIDGEFVPDMLDVGQYFIRYSTYSMDNNDFNPNDNVQVYPFYVTETTWSKEDGPITTSLRPGGGPTDYDPGNLYTTNGTCQDSFIFSDIQFSCSVNQIDGPLEGKSIDVYIVKVSEDVAPDWSNFNTQTDFKTNDHPQLDIVGFSTFTFDADDESFDIFTIPASEILDWETLLPTEVPVESGTRYFVLTSYVGSNNVLFHSIVEDLNYFQVSSVLFNDEWFLGGFGAGNTFVIRQNMELVTSIDEEPLPENAVHLYPNPATDQLNVQLDFEQAVHTTITIADLNGRVVNTRDYENIDQATLQMQTGHLPAGAYLLRIATEQGTKTKRFVVAK